MNFIKQLLLFTAVLLFFSSCEKDPPIDNGGEQDATINFIAQADGQDLIFYQDYTAPLNYRYQVETFRFYLSNIELINSNNEVIEVEDIALLKFREDQRTSPVVPQQITAQIPVGNYKELRFDLGVDENRNGQDPAQYDREHPLSIYQGMHWDWNTGYIFLKLEGRVDSLPGGNGQLDKSLLYHIGLNELRRSVSLDIDFKVEQGENLAALNLGVDIHKIFASASDTINISSEGYTQTMDVKPLAIRVADNASQSFYLRNE